MGIAGGFAKRVLHRTPEKNVKGRREAEWRKWQRVRSYICGEEHNSAIPEEDSESVKSSETGEPQPEQEKDYLSSKTSSTENSVERDRYERAARTIQSAFRNFQAINRKEDTDPGNEKQDLARGTESSSRESLSSSIIAQVGISEVFSVHEESDRLNRVHRRSKTEIFKLKEEWDDSTVSSKITKKRMQSKLEATTRRERALAYAFSQQLRICSKRKQGQPSGMEADIGWSWLERWMATRIRNDSFSESPESKPFESINREQRSTIQKRIFDVIGEGIESCGSNEVSIQSENFTRKASKETYKEQRLKATKTVSKRKTVPSHKLPRENIKVTKGTV